MSLRDAETLERRLRRAILEHLHRRQVVEQRFGVDFRLARRDVIAAMSRSTVPGAAPLALGAASNGTGFNWGLSAVFCRCLHRLAEEGLVELHSGGDGRLAWTRRSCDRLRSFRLSAAGVAFTTAAFATRAGERAGSTTRVAHEIPPELRVRLHETAESGNAPEAGMSTTRVDLADVRSQLDAELAAGAGDLSGAAGLAPGPDEHDPGAGSRATDTETVDYTDPAVQALEGEAESAGPRADSPSSGVLPAMDIPAS